MQIDNVARGGLPSQGPVRGFARSAHRHLPVGSCPRVDTDDELLARYRGGDDAAFAALYERHKRAVFGYLARLLGERARAEDVHQETWLQVVRLADRYRPGGTFKTWLFTLARSRCIDRLRRDRVRSVEVSIDLDSVEGAATESATADPNRPVGAYSGIAAAVGPEELRQREQTAALLRKVLARLPAAQREVFLLRDEADLSLVEVAAVLGVDYEAVRSRYRYALARLRAELADMDMLEE